MSRGILSGWDSRTTFVLALSTSAVGLGNLWRFSYLAGEHGGAPFVIAYIACLFIVAAPILTAEVIIGSHGRGSPVAAIRWAADRSLRNRSWVLVGLGACITGLLILCYYSVVAGWALAYVRGMQVGDFSAASAVMVGQYFEDLLAAPGVMIYWHSLFLLAVAGISALGVRRGLGMMAWITVPGLMVLLGVLVAFALEYGDLEATQDFLFSVKLIDFTPQSFLAALGHAFFTLGVGVGTGICFGAYAPDRIPIGRSVIAVTLFDLLFALGAGLAIFPVVFANNMEPAMGPGLMFISVPYAFGNMQQGELFGTLFFVMVVLAALGTVVALMEPIVSFLRQQLRCTRLFAVFMTILAAWWLCLALALSFNIWDEVLWFGKWNLFQFLDHLTAQWLLPLVSLGLVIFVGWRMRPAILREELYRESDVFFSQWLWWLRYIAPAAIIAVFVIAKGQ